MPHDLELTQLAGFGFECRPGCGLCCYASPALAAGDADRLLAIDPEFRPVGRAPGRVPMRPQGGACQYLANSSCRVHSARPAPCGAFPIALHLGERIQATLVLSCPGLPLDPLLSAPPRPSTGFPGLAGELASARRLAEELSASQVDRAKQSWRRSWAAAGLERESDLQVLRAASRVHSRSLTSDDMTRAEVPSRSDGLDHLPMFFDPQHGRVALAQHQRSVELLTLREPGGIDRRLGVLDAPTSLPRLEPDGERLLDGYLDFVLERDAFLGAALGSVRPRARPDPVSMVRNDLRALGGAVLTRAVWRERLAGRDGGRLGRAEVEAGIRATDSDWLDRPGIGRAL